jgi:N-acetylglutamate synthase-like GNAT family acetyltransferase
MKVIMDPIFILFLKHKETKKIIGFCQLHIKYFDYNATEIEVTYVCGSDYSGVGKILISFTKDFAKFIGLPIKIEAYVTSKEFYQKMGFECSDETNYDILMIRKKKDVEPDATVMCKKSMHD